MKSKFAEVVEPLVDMHTCSWCPTLILLVSAKPIFTGTPYSWT
jgi:hypothetical protein